MRDFSRLAHFLNSSAFQALRAQKNVLSDKEFVLAARSIWDAQINLEDIPVPIHSSWPNETMEGVSISWDEGLYIATFQKGTVVLRDNLIDMNIPLPFDSATDFPFIITEEDEEQPEFFVLTGHIYDDELFIFTGD